MFNKYTLAGLIALTLLAACDKAPSTPPVPKTVEQGASQAATAQATEISGVDLSKWNGEVDFAKIKTAGKRYVFIKATLGNSVVDPRYADNMQSARAAGLAAGSYHFYMTDDKPEAQFANFSKHVSLQAGDLPPVVDIEVLAKNSLPNLAMEMKMFLAMIEKKYGVKPIVYSGESFASEYLQAFGDYPLWLAEYNKDKRPEVPTYWKNWVFWQHSQGGTVAGVAGPVDLDRFNGDLQKLKTLLVK